jgi:hypothetical protein
MPPFAPPTALLCFFQRLNFSSVSPTRKHIRQVLPQSSPSTVRRCPPGRSVLERKFRPSFTHDRQFSLITGTASTSSSENGNLECWVYRRQPFGVEVRLIAGLDGSRFSRRAFFTGFGPPCLVDATFGRSWTLTHGSQSGEGGETILNLVVQSFAMRTSSSGKRTVAATSRGRQKNQA